MKTTKNKVMSGGVASLLKSAMVAAVLGATLGASALRADMIFQASFNGEGGGTGGANDLVNFGGTGRIDRYEIPQTQGGVTTSAPLGAGGGSYIHANSVGSSGGGFRLAAIFTPSSAANSLAAMSSVQGGNTVLHGAMDFFHRTNSAANPAGRMFIPFYPNSAPGGFHLELYNHNETSFGLRIFSYNAGAFLTGASLDQPINYVDVNVNNVGYNLGQVYHWGLTINTDIGTGVSTMSLFRAEGVGAIDTTSTDNLLGTVDFLINSSIVTAGMGSGEMIFLPNSMRSVGDVDADMDEIRLYDAVPTVFGAIPEPSSLLTGIFGGMMLLGMRRFGRKTV